MSEPVPPPQAEAFLRIENYRPRNLINRYDFTTKKWTVEVVWKPAGIEAATKDLTPRRFVMPCRALCDQNLKRIHFTCAMTYLGAGCRIIRSYDGRLPTVYEVESIIMIKVLKKRRFKRLKNWLMKYALTLVENTLAN